MDAKPRLLEQIRDKIRLKHYSYRTEQQYLSWIRRFILHNGKRHPREMSGGKSSSFFPTWPLTDKSPRPRRTRLYQRFSSCIGKYWQSSFPGWRTSFMPGVPPGSRSFSLQRKRQPCWIILTAPTGSLASSCTAAGYD